ncbi:MAG: ABC transporter ATP-binding protein [Chloroflexota bacterium]
MKFAVEMRGITKRFPGVIANDQVDFDLRPGEIHALLGENGAGKSTLMNVLAGLYQAEDGEIYIHDRPVTLKTPRDAIDNGVGMVHQHFMLVPSLSVTENILLGLDQPSFFLRLPEYHQQIALLEERFGLKVAPEAKIWQLSVGEQQRVEILKMLYRGADVLIMDEPTAVLAPSEVDELFDTLRSMTEQGKSIIFISHKLHEVMTISDRITVLRKGKKVGELVTKETSRGELAESMVGRRVLFSVAKSIKEHGAAKLMINDVHAVNDRGVKALNGVSLNVHEGEIVGIAGVAGNGQSELAEVITGLRSCISGTVQVDECQISNRSPKCAIDAQLAHIPMDRTGVGTAPSMNITDNLIMKSYRSKPVSKGWSIDQRESVKFAQQLKDDYQIIAPSLDTHVRLLSGGNLQRLILARETTSDPQVLLAVHPTRGLDVGAIEGVHRLLLEQRDAGAAILLVSEELDELLSLCDRVAVIYEGEIMGIVDESEADQIGLMMTGQRYPLEDIFSEGLDAS